MGNISEQDLKRLRKLELQLKNMKNNLIFQKQIDIESERKLLEEEITLNDLNLLEEKLNSLHFEEQLELNKFSLNNFSELENLNIDKKKKIEKALIVNCLKKASYTLEVPFIMPLLFTNNRYFLMLAKSLCVKKQLEFINIILKIDNQNYNKEELDHIKYGSDALNSAYKITNDNINELQKLEEIMFLRYKELAYDHEFLLYSSKLKSKLKKKQEKLKKKKLIMKLYILKNNGIMRKLKKKKIA